jgi:CheY-like chemotaxis protein/putative methionine-R-sulfoxide reductase with GAF domain
MEFLVFPAIGLILAGLVFILSHSRRFFFYLLWFLSVIFFVASALAFLVATSYERMFELISYHNISAVSGLVALIFAAVTSQSRERAFLTARLMEERQQRVISEITQMAASNSNLLELLNFSLDKIVTMLGFSGGAIHVFHKARENLVLGSYQGLSGRLARRLETIEYGDTSIGRTAKNKRLLIIRNLKVSEDYEFFGGQQDGFTYMALVPIVSEGENWGVITLFGKGGYQPGSLQVDLLEQFGEQLGAALVLGRHVRNIQSARDNLNSLVKALGGELCDTSSMAGSPTASVRSVGWLLARMFGGDRFDICKDGPDGWRIVLSSESTTEDRPINPRHDCDFSNLTAGIIQRDQPPPFEEFSEGKSYIYASLFNGEAWLFIRLEGRRRPVVDLELLTDSFRIVYGLLARMSAIRPPVRKPDIPPPGAESASVLSQISLELERLIAEYSGAKRDSDLRDLFIWLEIIQKKARKNSHLKEQKKAPSPKTLDLGQIVNDAILDIAAGREEPFEIAFEKGDNISAPDIPPDTLKKSVIAFLTAALFNAGSKAALRLTSKTENGGITLELRGESLASTPTSGERPTWLQEIGGRLECARLEDDRGETIDSWKLSIPIKRQGSIGQETPGAVRILAVDNQEVIRELLTGMLAGLGYDAMVVGSSDEVFTIFKAGLEENQPFTHVIADYGLDKISGLELARELKKLDPDIFFLLISGWGLTPDPQQASRMGIDMMLKKPFRMEQLAQVIGAGQRRASR